MTNKSNPVAFLLTFALVLAAIIFLSLRYPAPTPIASDDGDIRAEIKAWLRKPNVQVVSRDGDWVEIKLDTGELSYEPDPKHVYGEANVGAR